MSLEITKRKQNEAKNGKAEHQTWNSNEEYKTIIVQEEVLNVP